MDLPPFGGVSTGDGRPARRELGAGGWLDVAGRERLLLVATPRLLGGRAEFGGVRAPAGRWAAPRLLGGRAVVLAFVASFAERVAAVGLLPGVRAGAVKVGRLGARAALAGRLEEALRLLGGRWVAAARLLGGRCEEALRLLGGCCRLAPRLLGDFCVLGGRWVTVAPLPEARRVLAARLAASAEGLDLLLAGASPTEMTRCLVAALALGG
jgi:hypothetical protein